MIYDHHMYNGTQRYMTTREAARVLGVTTQTVYNWLKLGKIPIPERHPLTRRMQWKPEDVDRVRQILAGDQ
jgi:predicted site-specific integrase-resolvase